ncbi:GID complex subunit containing RING finger motif [Kalmusia sp. IMI 367209]|nr:GID complex subunit containing RING finger motif [Kalmusia sp. IMI 367209]
MAELTTTKLNAESHLLLDQPLLRMPHELSRRNQKNAQRYVENGTKDVLTTLIATTKTASKSASPDATLASLDSIISKMQGLKRKLENLHDEEMRIHKSNRARLQHLQDLYEVQSLVDVKYDEWSRTRLSRLLVDYLLREGYSESAAHLAASQKIEELVDVDAFVACHKIEKSLREERSTTLALNWCKENSKELKKQGSTLEFQLRLQQYIELVRQGHQAGIGDTDMDGIDDMNGVSLDGGRGAGEEKLVEARAHAKKYLSASVDFDLLKKAAGLLAYRPWDKVPPYADLYAESRWTHLAHVFLTTHHTLYSLPSRPLLHIALSAGLSALKTPACHSAYTARTTFPLSSTHTMPSTSVCPICSTELNELARNVPYAHHSKSLVESDPVVLPNGRVYGKERLRVFCDKVGVRAGWVRDPVEGLNGQLWRESEVRKVFIM